MVQALNFPISPGQVKGWIFSEYEYLLAGRYPNNVLRGKVFFDLEAHTMSKSIWVSSPWIESSRFGCFLIFDYRQIWVLVLVLTQTSHGLLGTDSIPYSCWIMVKRDRKACWRDNQYTCEVEAGQGKPLRGPRQGRISSKEWSLDLVIWRSVELYLCFGPQMLNKYLSNKWLN